MFDVLDQLTSKELRGIKVALSYAKGGTQGHKIFTLVDAMLTDREGITVKTARYKHIN